MYLSFLNCLTDGKASRESVGSCSSETGGDNMRRYVVIFVLLVMVAVAGCEKKNTVSVVAPDGKTSTLEFK